MSKVQWSFPEGLAIIIGDKTDVISVHVAMLLGRERIFLDDLEKGTVNSINNTNSATTEHENSTIDAIKDINSYPIIYLIGHRDIMRHTINSKNMKYVAEKLCDAGYNGKPTIYITSCEANKKFLGKSIRQLLKKELYNRNIQCKVLSHFDGLSIIISNANTVEGHNVKPCKICEKCGDYKQNNFIKSHPYTRKGIYMTVREFIEVNNFKIKLINILED